MRKKYSNKLDAVKYEYDFESGNIRRTKAGKVYPMPEQHVFAEELCRWLNKVLHHDGSWRVIWTSPVASKFDKQSGMARICVPTEVEAVWLDEDDDAHCKVTMDEDIWKLLETGMTHWAESCEEAWQRTMEMKIKIIGVQKDQTFKQAKGEKVDLYMDAPEVMPMPA